MEMEVLTRISTTCPLICALPLVLDCHMRTLVSNMEESVGAPVLLLHHPASLQTETAASSAQAININTVVQATDLSCIC